MEGKNREEMESALESFKECNSDLDRENLKRMDVAQGPDKSWLEDLKPKTLELTFGQKAVGFTFNPSGDPRVAQAKQLIADAIDLLEEVHREKTDNGAASSTWFRNVFRTEAFNQLVNASSSLVKYLTWQD